MQLQQYIDHTLLKPTALIKDIEKLCAEATKYQFASACVPPPFVKKTKALLQGSGVKTCTVIGFPFGYSAVEAKIAETLLAIVDGVDELDIVINLIALKNNDWPYLANEANHLIPIIKEKGKTVKIIIESGVLTDDEVIKCCELYGPAGIDYLKTSTGYAETGATLHAVELFKKHLPQGTGIKASGGIRDYQFARQLIEAGATRLGCSASVAIVEGGEGTGNY
ncbi:deoxyribose-phosphate aldolase [Niabella insulamsoli]|uniref:deoxyribose-phosphate aldolase n=1 Tax=Niabella insulamsoli TaxID=3144874 RepID=UPI0031FDD63B